MQTNHLYEDCWQLMQKQTVYVDIRETHSPNMHYFHMHSHYEISMILSGKVTVLLPEQMNNSSNVQIVMLPPLTQHYMIPDKDCLYRRINVSFTEKFVSEMPGEWAALRKIFPKNGAIILPNPEQISHLERMFTLLKDEQAPFRERLLLMYCLSLLCEFQDIPGENHLKTPEYILQALQYISEHFSEKIVAQDLAGLLGISRTTLMNGFQRYVGLPMHQYQLNLRLRYAERLRSQGMSVSEAAIRSGFCDIGGYIRAYKRIYRTTPTGKI